MQQETSILAIAASENLYTMMQINMIICTQNFSKIHFISQVSRLTYHPRSAKKKLRKIGSGKSESILLRNQHGEDFSNMVLVNQHVVVTLVTQQGGNVSKQTQH